MSELSISQRIPWQKERLEGRISRFFYRPIKNKPSLIRAVGKQSKAEHQVIILVIKNQDYSPNTVGRVGRLAHRVQTQIGQPAKRTKTTLVERLPSEMIDPSTSTTTTTTTTTTTSSNFRIRSYQQNGQGQPRFVGNEEDQLTGLYLGRFHH